jgi:hypothetical protein
MDNRLNSEEVKIIRGSVKHDTSFFPKEKNFVSIKGEAIKTG